MKLKSIAILFLISLLVIDVYGQSGERPKVGVVLSGGGAKGFAHIGLLKALDSLQIPVDYVAGTSMGGIIGALYAIGYSGKEIETLAARRDWQEIFTDKPPRSMLPYFQKKETGKYQLEFGFDGIKPVPPSGLVFGQKISLLFSSLTLPYEQVQDFDNLPIPFRCVSADLITGDMIVLKHGSLAKAMRATMAIPTIFSPVEYGDSLLIDGGIINNLPVDVVKQMGADIIIASDVGHPERDQEELRTALQILEQSISIIGQRRWKENQKQADVLVRPNMDGFTIADFDNKKIQTIIQRGEVAVQEQMPDLVAIRDKYNLERIEGDENLREVPAHAKIYGVQITGYTTIPFNSIYNKLNLKIGSDFNPDLLEQRILELRLSGDFASVQYEVIPVSEEYVRILVRVKEKQKPAIHGVYIKGNKTLPFNFVYRLLGVHPLDVLNLDYINQRIMELYGLGYFESIVYNIEPVRENQVNITFVIRELPVRKLRVGLRYDDLHKLVAAVSIQATNLLIPGLRLENELQFAGLTRFRADAYYPSRTLNMPVYPSIGIEYHDIPLNIFSFDGRKLANYKDRSFTFSGGIGFLIGKSFNAQAEYQFERVMTVPNIGSSDPAKFPSWHENLQKLHLFVDADNLDNVLLPREGVVFHVDYEGSLAELHTDRPFTVITASLNRYRTFSKRHTLRLYGFYGTGSDSLPLYRFIRRGGPDTFVGVQYNQISGRNMIIARMDYRYEFKKDIFFKLMANAAFDLQYNRGGQHYRFNNLRGFGAGVKFLSPVGPLEFIVSRGDRNFIGQRAWQNVYYIKMGYYF